MHKGISLFSGAGIGDLGFRAAGIRFLAHCELEPERAHLAEQNFPEAKMFVGDIWQEADKIISHFRNVAPCHDDDLFIVTCTAPCQGMSKSGRGKLLREWREGRRPQLDPRNRLILPALRVIKALRPRFAVFENVPEMRDTLIEDEAGEMRPILDIVRHSLGDDYAGEAYDLEVADYGVPQRRARLITVYTRDPAAKASFAAGVPLIPETTHNRLGTGKKKRWVSVSQALRAFPPLDAGTPQTAAHPQLPFHRVSVLDERKYFWVSNTPVGGGAFDNQCVNPKCGFDQNPTHGNRRDRNGINQSRKDTPIYCEKCGELLPRPTTVEPDGSIRLMSGYTSAYKRMSSDLPSPTLTRNFGFACSDNKLHPTQHRVLSIAEALTLHTLDQYEYDWGEASDSIIRLVIGESIPPKATEFVMSHLIKVASGKKVSSGSPRRLETYATM